YRQPKMQWSMPLHRESRSSSTVKPKLDEGAGADLFPEQQVISAIIEWPIRRTIGHLWAGEFKERLRLDTTSMKLSYRLEQTLKKSSIGYLISSLGITKQR